MHYSPSRLLQSQNSVDNTYARISKSTAGGRSVSNLALKPWKQTHSVSLNLD